MMNARELKDRLYARHPAGTSPMWGPWTVLEEFNAIDLLAISAWSSQGRYARVGYEVKVSRSDYRREVLSPSKRQRYVEWCNEFYFAVPKGLLTEEEIGWKEPPEFQQAEAFAREPCPETCYRRRRDPYADTPADRLSGNYHHDDPGERFRTLGEWRTCETCGGAGHLEKSLAEREGPTLWVPADVGLVLVDRRGTKVARKSPRRNEVPALSPSQLGDIVRWVSVRPDPRHHPKVLAEDVAA